MPVEAIGVVGCGTMGAPIARRLARAGYRVYIYDLRPAAMEALVGEPGITPASSPAAVAAVSDLWMTVLPSGDRVLQVVLGAEGMVTYARPGIVFMDLTTSGPGVARQLADALNPLGVGCLDSPMTGGRLGAEKGELVLMVGGDPAVLDKVRAPLLHVARDIVHVGPTGAGQAMKLVHNVVSHAIFLATCEGAVLGLKAGIPLDTVVAVLQAGNARSYATEVRFPKFILSGAYNGGATLDIVYKDIGLAREMATDVAAPHLPMLMSTFTQWQSMVQNGHGARDYTEAFRLIARQNGVEA